jgi:cyclohexanecarboxyl-CoA dehydrogenase
MFRLWTEEEDEFRAHVRRFAERELAPHYQSDDKTGTLHPAIREGMGKLGLLGLRIPEEYGGQGADAVTVGIAAEEISRSNINAAYLLLSAALAADIILSAASPAQKRAWLPGLADGSVLPTLALTEPGHGSDAAHLMLRATRANPGTGWLLTGEKTSISLADQAETAIVFARTGGDGARGVSAFYVDLNGSQRLSTLRLADVGDRASGRCSIFFDEFPVGADRLIGDEGSGFVSVMRGFEYSRALIGLMVLGTADQALQDAIGYARDRHTFGQPISTRQGVAFPLVEQATYLAAARHLCYETLVRKDLGQDHTAQSGMAKWWAPKVAVEAIHQALLTYGHAAWSDDNPQAQRLRDVMGFEIADGTAQIAKLVVARKLFGREYAP